jgi:acetyltransferase-like isoleucine patch superfamily enzyme
VFVNWDCYFDLSAPVTIGSNTRVADHVRIVTSTHSIGSKSRRAGEARALPVTIKSGSWIGSGCTVLPGVTVESGCIIAAGAVVAASTRANGLYAGVPARRMRDLPA